MLNSIDSIDLDTASGLFMSTSISYAITLPLVTTTNDTPIVTSALIKTTSGGPTVLLGDAIVLCLLTAIGILGNLLIMLSIVMRHSLRKVVNMFLLHHCFINLVECLLFIPMIIALLSDAQSLRGCEILGGTFVTMVSANVLNIAAMTACEAYRFEDYTQQHALVDAISTSASETAAPSGRDGKRSLQPSHDEHNSTASFACVVFGLSMIWLASIILHLGITLIGSDAKQFYNYAIRNCFFVIGDRQTYILYIMWILLTAVSLALTIVYVKKIYRDVSRRKRANAKFFVNVPLLMQQQEEHEKQQQRTTSLKRSNSTNSACKRSTRRALNSKLSRSHTQLSALEKLASNMPIQRYAFAFPPNDMQLTDGASTMSSLRRKHNEHVQRARHRYDTMKQILQRIKLQFLVIKLFVICWMPLFVTVALDSRFEVSASIYRYLTLVAFANSAITPYCYLTILAPRLNKYCLPFMRTDGKQSRKKTAMRDAMDSYYEKLGNRFFNLSDRSQSVDSIMVAKTTENASPIQTAMTSSPSDTRHAEQSASTHLNKYGEMEIRETSLNRSPYSYYWNPASNNVQTRNKLNHEAKVTRHNRPYETPAFAIVPMPLYERYYGTSDQFRSPSQTFTAAQLETLYGGISTTQMLPIYKSFPLQTSPSQATPWRENKHNQQYVYYNKMCRTGERL